jgi:hypothetical protein
MTLVRIIKNWDEPDLLRQTPGGKGLWGDVEFTIQPVKSCDYVVILNYLNEDLRVECPKENIWCVKQEPNVRQTKFFSRSYKYCSKIFIHSVEHKENILKKEKYIYSHPAVPWHVNKSYDELIKLKYNNKDKIKEVSCVMSDKKNFPGHRQRLKFLNNAKKYINIDHFGRGFAMIENKWDGLHPYKYSIAIENSSSCNYWTEKISDCFLSWTVPIYYGCKNINRYFPSKSFYFFDINDERSIFKIKEFLENDNFKERLPYVEEARELILNKYNFFNFISENIKAQIFSPYKHGQKEKLFFKKRRRFFL